MAGAAGYSVTISLYDQATAKLDAINKRLTQLRAPAENFNKSLARFSQETGLTQIANRMAGMARSATDLARGLFSVVAPLSAIGSAASLAGIYKLSEAFAGTAMRLSNMGSRLGISGSALASFENAGRQAGVPIEALDSALETFRDTMVAFADNRASGDVQIAMRALGISIQQAGVYAKDSAAAFPLVAERLRTIHDPSRRLEVATLAYGSAAKSLLPIIAMSTEEYRRSMEVANAHGHVTERQIALGLLVGRSQAALTGATEDLSNRVMEKLSPALIELLDWFTKIIDANKADWAGWLGKRMEELVGWLKSPAFGEFRTKIGGIGTAILAVIDNTTNWKVALGVALAIFAGPAILTAFTVLAAFATAFRLLTATSTAAGVAIAKTMGLSSSGGGWSGLATMLAGATPIGRALLLTTQLYDSMREAGKARPGGSLLDQYARKRFGDPNQKPILPGAMPYVPGFGGPSAPMPLGGATTPAPRTDSSNGFTTYGNYYDPKPDYGVSYQGGIGGVGASGRMAEGRSPAVPMPSTAERSRNLDETFAYLTAHGRSNEAAAGIVANEMAESGGDPANVGDGGLARGSFQDWPERRKNIMRATKDKYGYAIDVATDFNHLHQVMATDAEMGTTEKDASDAINASRTAYDAGATASRRFERPHDVEGEAARRGLWAQQNLARLIATRDANAAAAASAALDVRRPAAGAPLTMAARGGDAGAAEPLKGAVTVTVTHANAPPGATITATATGNVIAGKPRVETALPQMASP